VLQFIVIFCVSVVGSLVGLTAQLAHRFFVRKTGSEFITAGSSCARTGGATPQIDPVITVGAILACYGAIALAFVCAVPAPLALERTVLTFAFLCIGGLIGEISQSNSGHSDGDSDAADDRPIPRKPPSRGLSLTLAVVLNLAMGVLCAGNGLIDIVPASVAAASNGGESAQGQELQPIFVVAQRPEPAQSERVGPAYQL
jgi:hypothetical protein